MGYRIQLNILVANILRRVKPRDMQSSGSSYGENSAPTIGHVYAALAIAMPIAMAVAMHLI